MNQTVGHGSTLQPNRDVDTDFLSRPNRDAPGYRDMVERLQREGDPMDELLRVDVDGGKYTVVSREGEQLRILRYGDEWMGPGFPGSNAVFALASELGELRAAGIDLYKAGRWTCDREVDAGALWTRFRDALDLPPGTATALGMNQQPAEEVSVTIKVDAEDLRLKLNELSALASRAQGLLEANNREVERRRAAEAMLHEAASLFRTYEAHHRAKASEAGRPEKAERNAEIAGRIEAHLAGSAA